MKPYFWRIEWQFRASVSDARKHFLPNGVSDTNIGRIPAGESSNLCKHSIAVQNFIVGGRHICRSLAHTITAIPFWCQGQRRKPLFIYPWCRGGLLLVGHSILKIDRQIRVNSAPILTSASPLFRDVHHCQIQHLKQAVIRREDGLCFGYLAKLAVEAFYRIGRINQPSKQGVLFAISLATILENP